MQTTKTIQGGITNLTNAKEELLNQEYNNLQKYLQGEEDVELYSANKQQAERYYDKIKKDKEYPISIRKDLIDTEKCNSDVCNYFVKIPVAGRYGGLKVPVNTHCEIPEDAEIGESKLYKEDGRFYINITVTKEVQARDEYDGVLTVDIGQRYLAVSVASHRNQPRFQGRDIRGIRRHYNWLRKKLGEKKLKKEINRLNDKEKRKVNQRLHEIAKNLVEEADEHNEVIAIGNLKGLRKNNKDKGKTFNRIISNFPYGKFTEYIEYKAREKGIRVIKVNEHYTTRTCSKCGYRKESRPSKEFKCPNCGYRVNADFNGAKNIFKKARKDLALGNVPRVGALSEQALNSSRMTSTSALVSRVTERRSPFLTSEAS